MGFLQNYRSLKILRSGRFDRFRQFAWIPGLLTLRIAIDRIYLGNDVYHGCFGCETESSCRFFQKYRSLKTSGVELISRLAWSLACSCSKLFNLQIITSSDFDFKFYLDFCMVLSVKLNSCTKFVLQYRYTAGAS